MLRAFGVGFWLLMLKLAPKLFKSVKVIKVALALTTAATYSYMYTWKFALAIMITLAVHESGHVWAMKRLGLRTKGFYFIPFIGGAAISDDAFPGRWAEVYIALMGPVWGLLLAIASGFIYALTNNPMFAAVAGWMAVINLFNLLPINPLDGGRVFKSIAFSVHSWIGLIFLFIGLIATGFLAYFVGFGIFLLLLLAGLGEMIVEYRNRKRLPPMNSGLIFASIAWYFVVAGALLSIVHAVSHIPGADIAKQLLQ